jgi:hypothetical protein
LFSFCNEKSRETISLGAAVLGLVDWGHINVKKKLTKAEGCRTGPSEAKFRVTDCPDWGIKSTLT